MLKNTEFMTEYFSFFLFIIFSLLFCLLMLCAGWLLGGKSKARYKNTPFESGIIPIGDTYLHFSIKFYLIAIFFVIFDVEALYLYAWSTSIYELGWTGLIEATIFIASLLIGLFYLVCIGALN